MVESKNKSIFVFKPSFERHLFGLFYWSFPLAVFWVNAEFLGGATPRWLLAILTLMTIWGSAARLAQNYAFKSEAEAMEAVRAFFAGKS